MRSTAKELRFHTKEILNSVERGEEVVITFRGKPYAKIVPLKKSKNESGSRRIKNELFGIWKNRKDIENVDEYVRDLRKSRFHVND